MKNSCRYFKNDSCEFFPCHPLDGDFNCLFCYCPLYFLDECPGNFYMKEDGEKRIKVCTDCVFPHIPENYGEMMEILRKKIK